MVSFHMGFSLDMGLKENPRQEQPQTSGKFGSGSSLLVPCVITIMSESETSGLNAPKLCRVVDLVPLLHSETQGNFRFAPNEVFILASNLN